MRNSTASSPEAAPPVPPRHRAPRLRVGLLALSLIALSGCIMGQPTGPNTTIFTVPTPNIAAVLKTPTVAFVPGQPLPPVAVRATNAPLPTLPPAPTTTPSNEEQPRVGFRAPDFELEAVDGGAVKLSDLRGRPVFINFWATWCGPCKVEMPDIEQVYQANRDHGLVVLGVDVQEPNALVEKYLGSQETTFSWKFVLDKNGDVLRKYRVTGIPSSFFVDKDGIVRDIVIGTTTKAVMEAKLGPLVQQ